MVCERVTPEPQELRRIIHDVVQLLANLHLLPAALCGICPVPTGQHRSLHLFRPQQSLPRPSERPVTRPQRPGGLRVLTELRTLDGAAQLRAARHDLWDQHGDGVDARLEVHLQPQASAFGQ